MYSRVFLFPDQTKNIVSTLFWFSKHKSTSLAILDAGTKLIEAIEDKRFSLCIFLDLAKSFYTDNYENKNINYVCPEELF